MSNYQLPLPFIQHTVGTSVIPQRTIDGYINATEMCKAVGKQMSDYTRLNSSNAFFDELSVERGIPRSQLIQIVKGNVQQATWVHPEIAIHLAQWLSPKFAVMVSKWVYDWMSGTLKPVTALPSHILRHQLNMGKIPVDCFSVLQEMTYTLVAPLEAQGYSLPAHLMPDISQAKLFCKHLRDVHHIDTNAFNTYSHEFPDGRIVPAKLYPVGLLGIFRQLMAQQWLPQAEKYFKTRDANALPALQQLLQITYNPPSNNSAYKVKA